MIPVKNEIECHTGKSEKSSTFGMEFNPKAFSILSDQLYTHKKRATIREYCTNAHDSHVDAGIPNTPFKVHMPTVLEPYFETEDFGLGLDEEGVMNTFATFFHSTKETSNEVNGCLGLGSKAGFTVSAQFTVTAVKDGVSRLFVCHKDKTGTPVVSLKRTAPTTKGNGVAIRIPVDSKELGEWQKELIRIIACFDVTPIHNITDEQQLTTLASFQKQREDIRKSEHGFINMKVRSECKVLMGNVLYPVEDPLQYIRSDTLRKFVAGMIDNVSVRIKADLGDLNIAPSREALSLDPHTKRTLEHKITKLVIQKYREVLSEVDGSVDSYYTMYHKFKNTSLWNILLEMRFPFTDGYQLRKFEQERYYSNYALPSMKLLKDDVFDGMKGFVPTAGEMKPSVLSQAFKSMGHRRIREWKNIRVMTGNGVRLRDTMKNYSEKHPEVGAILWSDNPTTIKQLQKVFGIEDIPVINAEEYFVPKVRKKVARKDGRKAKGKLESHVVMASSVTPDDRLGYSEVDLSKGSVAYIDSDDFFIGIDKKVSSTFVSVNSEAFRQVVGWLGLDRVVIANANNSGKIKAAGVSHIKTLWIEKVKANKRTLINNFVWKGVDIGADVDYRDDSLIKLTKGFKKMNKVVENKTTTLEGFPRRVSAYGLGLSDTKLFKQEADRCDKLQNEIVSEVDKIKSELPLWNSVRNCEESAHYYLRLEKVIK